MTLFGYKGCDERRKDYVLLTRKSANLNIIVAKQLSTSEAKKCYNELKKLFCDTAKNLEITDVDGDIFFIPKDEVGKIKWRVLN